MARIRTIKPDFFKNENLSDLSMSARLLFIGLWTLSDRRGRLEDRPKRIKVEVFPYDNVDCEDLLSRLQSAGFILRYKVEHTEFGDMKLIQVLNFEKHQRITGSEADSESVYPAPNEVGNILETTRKQQGNNKDDRKGREGNGKEMEGKGFAHANFEKIFVEIMGSEVWIQGIAMQQQLEIPFVIEKLEYFLNELKLKDDYHKGIKDIKSHFINWLKKEKEKSSAKKESNGDSKNKFTETIAGINSILRK